MSMADDHHRANPTYSAIPNALSEVKVVVFTDGSVYIGGPSDAGTVRATLEAATSVMDDGQGDFGPADMTGSFGGGPAEA